MKQAALERADVLAAPSLGGESFGMVLTEGFAAGTPVVASDIAGYRDVVRDGVDGLLVPRGDATALAETLRDLALDPRAHRRARRGGRPQRASATPGRRSPRRSSTPTRTRAPCPSPRARAARRRADRRAARRPRPAPPARRLPSLEPRRRAAARRAARRARRGRRGAAPASAALLAVQRIGVHRITIRSSSSPTWVLLGLALMCASMIFRAVSWHAILRPRCRGAAALHRRHARHAVGVLMSATLPARLGEPSRALIVARRLGRRARRCRSCSARSSRRRFSTCSRW